MTRRTFTTFLSATRLLVGLTVLAPAASQAILAQESDVEVRLRSAELEYTTASSEWESATAAFRAAEARWQRALADVNAAEASGDEDAYKLALARFHTQAIQLETQEARERETAGRMSDTRGDLMAVLAESRDELYRDALDADNPEETRELAALYQDRDNRYRELEREGAPPGRIQPVTLPEVTFDPRDGPDEIEGKIRLLELRIRQIEVQVTAIDERIGALEKRQRQERDLQSLITGVERFDDAFVPVTSPDPLTDMTDTGAAGAALPSDSTVVTLDEMSLQQQIEGLKLLREQMFARKQHLEGRTEGFRQRLLRMTTS